MIMKTLFTCEGLNKQDYGVFVTIVLLLLLLLLLFYVFFVGMSLIRPLIEEFLFSASKRVLTMRDSPTADQEYTLDLKSITPKYVCILMQ